MYILLYFYFYFTCTLTGYFFNFFLESVYMYSPLNLCGYLTLNKHYYNIIIIMCTAHISFYVCCSDCVGICGKLCCVAAVVEDSGLFEP